MAEESFLELRQNDNLTSFRNKCNCLPVCTSIEYYGDIDRVKFKPLSMMMEKSLLHVNTLRRIETQFFTDFFAICGGLLGLFLGVSVLTIIEFIYYFTLRLYWTHRLRSQNTVTPIQQRDNNAVFINMDDE